MLLSVYVAATVRMPTPVVDQALEVTLPWVIMLAAVRVPAKLALVVAIVPTIVPSILPAVILPDVLIIPLAASNKLPPLILPDDSMLPPTLMPPAPMARAYELVMAATFVLAAGALAMYTVAAVVTRVLAAVVANEGWLITCT